MGLYLCILDADDEEIDGLELGSYADYGSLIKQVVHKLEGGTAGMRFPVFVLHSDCDGSWTREDCAALETELCSIIEEFKKLEAVPFNSDWQFKIARQVGHCPRNLHQSFIDVDGELLLDRLLELARKAQRENAPIVFQ
ncbi:Imm70 family immunity protein [Prosthecobacter sp.]|uniref:Imm70 family immunity protein n=1 Tax=Prosthecobacter sp. TaxID=1965333 RepID=UPI0037849992